MLCPHKPPLLHSHTVRTLVPAPFHLSPLASLPKDAPVIPPIAHPSSPLDTPSASHSASHSPASSVSPQTPPGLDSSRSLRQNRVSPIIPHGHASISTSARPETARVSFQAHRSHIPPRLPVPISLAFFHPLTHPLTHPPCPHLRSPPSPLPLSPLPRSPPHSSPPFH